MHNKLLLFAATRLRQPTLRLGCPKQGIICHSDIGAVQQKSYHLETCTQCDAHLLFAETNNQPNHFLVALVFQYLHAVTY